MRKYTKIFMAVLVLGLLLLFLGVSARSTSSPSNTADEVARAVESDRKRFRPENSLDIGMAMGLITHDPPRMLNPPSMGPPLLLFPPSAETLATLSGP